MGETLKLFGWKVSPYSHRAEVALRLKGVKYEFIHEDLANKSDMLIRYNPILKKIPVLLHGDTPIVESQVIVEYIDEVFDGHPILPKDPYERAEARFWARFIDEKVRPQVWMSCWTDGETQKSFIAQAKESLAILQGRLEGKKFFGGDSIGLIDIMACSLALWFGVMQEVVGLNLLNEDDYPELCRWGEEYRNAEAVKECLPERELIVGFFAPRKDRIFAKKAPVYD
ncbi:Glutathione S-transferase [Rhynchospora pubera]|uniref:Glutathione-dependent dehydroascorbate reductase n=1 Tax=Rhynchospora pubera TaxID=906938 RepID=A0AAV8EJ66_9POAL|nr:Glutathione S-transferase [Rhynchospora pubera]KAJ4787087.1 Glutathione S-transferase [Rhynchospora pubera]